jgi:hypothetical protein
VPLDLRLRNGQKTLLDQGGEQLVLVNRVHGQPDRVFGKAHFKRMFLCHDLARSSEIVRQLAIYELLP